MSNKIAQHTDSPTQNSVTTTPEIESLRGKRILIVGQEYKSDYKDEFSRVTGEDTTYIRRTRQSTEKITEQIIEQEADIILIEFFLQPRMSNGTEISQELRRRGVSTPIIIFTDIAGIDDEILEKIIIAGNVSGVIHRSKSDPKDSIKKVVEFIKSQETSVNPEINEQELDADFLKEIQDTIRRNLLDALFKRDIWEKYQDLLQRQEIIDRTESLREQKILMIDDESNMIERFMPKLLVATNGKAYFILHNQKSADELVEEIMKKQADMILMDLSLAYYITGTDITSRLREKGVNTPIVIFTASNTDDEMYRRGLKICGASDVIHKSEYDTDGSIREIAEFMKS